MNTNLDFKVSEDRIVYVRSIATKDLPDALRAQTGDLSKVYGIYGSNGEQIALTKDRDMAFDLARNNALRPMSVH